MSTMLDERRSQSPPERLRMTMAAARLSFTWLGVRKSLNPQQRDQAADSFGAEGKFVSAAKKLLDTNHPKFKEVTAIRGRAISYWKGVSLPFPETGIRLIRQDMINEFDGQIDRFREELDDAVAELDRHYDELRSAARDRLGDLFDWSDYPPSLVGAFAIERDYPSVDAPAYLRQINPELYESECRRMQSRFEEAVELAEQAFTGELVQLVDHMTERLNGQVDGKPKVFRDSVVKNLSDFFGKFRHLNVRSNEQLDQLVEQAQNAVRGIEPQQLRDDQAMRQRVASQMSAVQASLDQLLVDRPRRNILRRPR